MRIFSCGNCGSPVFFENHGCVQCGARLGFTPGRFDMVSLALAGDRWVDSRGIEWRFCANAVHDACNWLVDAGDTEAFCLACRHNRTVPDLTRPADLDNWRRIEAAKRHLFYSILRWKLPTPTRSEDSREGLAFDFLADFEQSDGTVQPVLTGHESGLITINIAEGDDAERERRRTLMGEPYRTLLGHFRHEVGHYYWDRLVRDRGHLDGFRGLFGDEQADYAGALRQHYENGPAPGWQLSFISSYAAAHPWEDFAETWAHYIHIVDTLETARAFGLDQNGGADDPYDTRNAVDLVAAWVPLTIAINAVNRSMGQHDLYPFVLSDPVIAKLQFVCDMVHQS